MSFILLIFCNMIKYKCSFLPFYLFFQQQQRSFKMTQSSSWNVIIQKIGENTENRQQKNKKKEEEMKRIRKKLTKEP